MSATAAAVGGDTATRRGLSSAWLNPWTLVVGILALSVAALWPTWQSLHGFWADSSRYSHGYLVAAIVPYMVLRLRPLLQASPTSPSVLGLFGLIGLLLVWIVANLGSIQAIHQILLPAILWAACLAVLGWRRAGSLVLPIGYLYLAVPVWESGNFVLQFLTVHAVGFALAIADIPAFIDGNSVSLAAGTFEIASGCSGLHYLIVSIAIAVLYAWLYLKSVRSSFALVGIVILIALLTNWIRVFIVIVAGHVTDMQHYLVTVDHYNFGWLLYFIAMLPLLWVSRRIEWSDPAGDDKPPAPTAPLRARRSSLLAFSLVIVLLMASSAVIYARMPVDSGQPVSVELPGDRGGWMRLASARPDWQPYYSGASGEALATYESDGQRVNVYANVYRVQSQGNELIGYENRIQGQSDTWRPADYGMQQVVVGRDEPLQFRELQLASPNGARRLVFYRYNVGGRHFVGDLHAKLYYGIAVLAGQPAAGVEMVSVRCQESCEQARAVLHNWLDVYGTGGRLANGTNNEQRARSE